MATRERFNSLYSIPAKPQLEPDELLSEIANPAVASRPDSFYGHKKPKVEVTESMVKQYTDIIKKIENLMKTVQTFVSNSNMKNRQLTTMKVHLSQLKNNIGRDRLSTIRKLNLLISSAKASLRADINYVNTLIDQNKVDIKQFYVFLDKFDKRHSEIDDMKNEMTRALQQPIEEPSVEKALDDIEVKNKIENEIRDNFESYNKDVKNLERRLRNLSTGILNIEKLSKMVSSHISDKADDLAELFKKNQQKMLDEIQTMREKMIEDPMVLTNMEKLVKQADDQQKQIEDLIKLLREGVK
jgi:hypothetical protein